MEPGSIPAPEWVLGERRGRTPWSRVSNSRVENNSGPVLGVRERTAVHTGRAVHTGVCSAARNSAIVMQPFLKLHEVGRVKQWPRRPSYTHIRGDFGSSSRLINQSRQSRQILES